MKNLLFVTVLISTTALADVDYSRCNLFSSGFVGPQIDHDGKVHPGMGQHLKDKKTEGKIETYTFISPGIPGVNKAGEMMTYHYKIERDDSGKVIKVTTGGETMSPTMIKIQKEFMVRNAMYSGMPHSGGMAGDMTLLSEPQFLVQNKHKAIVSVPVHKLTKDQAKSIGWNNFEEVQKMRQQWRKDKKTVRKLHEGYKTILDKAPLSLQMGMESEFVIEDGACKLKKYAHRATTTRRPRK